MTVTADTILVRDSEPLPATVNEEVVVLSMRAGAYFGFNRVGTEIWNMLSEPRRVDQIFDALSQLHDVDAEAMIRDVTPFLQTLIERRLVRVVDPGEPDEAKTMRRIYLREAAVMLVVARLAVRFVPPARVFAWTRLRRRGIASPLCRDRSARRPRTRG